MSFGKNYNNENKQPVQVTYTPMSFSNPESPLSKSRLSFSYLNRLLKVSIAMRNNENTNDNYATYDTDNEKVVYVSHTKAHTLLNAIKEMEENDDIHNVCIETNYGLLLVSDGSEFGSSSPCIAIITVDDNKNFETTIYQTKSNYYKSVSNYTAGDSTFTEKFHNSIELDEFKNLLAQYVNASTYAIASTVMEAGMYKRNAMNERIYAIAEKVGAITSNKGGGYKNNSILGNGGSSSSSPASVPEEYEESSFDDIANSLMA